ncbi:MAG: hypothetical protein RIG62_18295 [Cyclobacteriaceae bacterium]
MRKLTVSCLALLCLLLSNCQEDHLEAKLPTDCATGNCSGFFPRNPPVVRPLSVEGLRTRLVIDSEKFTMGQTWGPGFAQLSSFSYSTFHYPVYRYRNNVIEISTPKGVLRFRALSSATKEYSPYVSNLSYQGKALTKVEGTFQDRDGRVTALRSVFDSPNYQHKINRASIYTSHPGWTVILEDITCKGYPLGYPYYSTDRFLAAVSVPLSILN